MVRDCAQAPADASPMGAMRVKRIAVPGNSIAKSFLDCVMTGRKGGNGRASRAQTVVVGATDAHATGPLPDRCGLCRRRVVCRDDAWVEIGPWRYAPRRPDL